jgi:uncharacterized cofD-like protein
VAALGGGHGLATTLQAVRRYAGRVTAVVSAADDGGSSGRLRETLGIPPPGDLRRCLVALGDPDSRWARAFEHRFEAGELEGHPVGNLVIAGLATATGDFTAAVEEAGRLVGAVGRVVPATPSPVVLGAEVEGTGGVTRVVEGQVKVANAEGIRVVWVAPVGAAATAPAPEAVASGEAVDAIVSADQVVLGPGSLYTSVLAVAVVPGIRGALERTTAQKVYVCNLRPQVPETGGFRTADHVRALARHGVEVDAVVHDPATMPGCGCDDGTGLPPGWPRCVAASLARPDGGGHDPARLAATLFDLLG